MFGAFNQTKRVMKNNDLSRRHFIQTTAAFAGATLLAPLGLGAAEPPAKRTAVDQVTLGKTGIKLSRLGIGTGSNSGNVQWGLGQEGFNRLIKYAYDQGITYIDAAQSYKTHGWIGQAIKGLPREKLFIQTKMSGVPKDPLAVIDQFRKNLDTDYIDSLLTHCATTPDWDDQRKRVLDAFEEAKEKKLIRSHGVSCHGLPALTRAAKVNWVDVHLVRINPQGAHVDVQSERWDAVSDETSLPKVMEQIKAMRDQGRGIIGMKIIGNGDFKKAEDREKSIQFAMKCGLLDAVVIGFASPAEIDEAIERINRALA
jgi:predicted aldo/keto reductase-like oxidoreductase